MPRPATGQVVVDKRRRSPTYSLRFRAYGRREYVTLGNAEDGWTQAKAQTELENVLADVRRGIWRPPVVEAAPVPREVPTFHVFASEWFERQTVEGGRRGGGLSDAGKADLQWRLSNHLLPAFASRRLDQIIVEDVDRYRLGKVREGKLNTTSINKSLATLVFAGLRIGEALSLRWRDIDLARGTITVRAAKTDAGVRVVNILPVLRDELGDYRARLDPKPEAVVFATATGRRQGATNVRRRMLAKAVEQANKHLAKNEAEPLPESLTPHSLRRTFASLLFAVGETPPYVMVQMGHTTASLTLTIYARQMNRRDGEPERLKALVEGREWAAMGSSGDISVSKATITTTGGERKPTQ